VAVITAVLAAGLVGLEASGTHAATPALTSTPYGNLAEVLQKSLYFYDAEKSGPARTLGRQPLEWRGDSEPSDSKVPLVTGPTSDGLATEGTNLPAAFITKYRPVLDPDGDGYLDLSEGFHDAGDHVKFGLPQAYSAATLGWGVYEFKDAFVRTKTYDHVMDELRWFSDYFLKSTFRDAAGTVVAFAYMVGRGSMDHTYWGPPELQKTPRAATFAYAGAPASDQASGTAAALTVMSLLTRDTDASYAARCLDTAKALYRFAVNNRGTGNGDGFYPSSFDDDEMAWAASWLYVATGTRSYLDDVVGTDASGTYTGYLKKIIANPQSTWQNIWVHSWDTVWGGVFALLAPATTGVLPTAENQRFWYYFRWNLEYWSGGAVPHVDPADTNFLKASPAGYGVLATWGSARYNTAAQLCALIYRKHSGADPTGSAPEGSQLSQWALSQMNYLIGANPLHRSYVVGFTAKSGDTSAAHPHHRAAHGSSINSMLDPPNHKHTLWGALVGGPDDADQHKDLTTDYVYNEVAIDYSAGFVGALAGLFEYFGAGQTVTAWTPPAEPRETAYFDQAKLEQETGQRTQVTVQIHNAVTHPPAFVDDLSLRYYFDISELVAKGQSIKDVSVEVYYDEAKVVDGKPATISGPTPADATGTRYYLTVSWAGIPFYGKRDLQFGLIAAQDSSWRSNWDPSNDFSHVGLSGTAVADTTHTPVYRAGVRVYGDEPSPDTPAPTSPPTSAPSSAPSSTPPATRAGAPAAHPLPGPRIHAAALDDHANLTRF
jgi:hypothetical protein